jgi:hypothetical protein
VRVTFSYGDFIAKISLATTRRSRRKLPGATAAPGLMGDPPPALAALDAATAAAESLQDRATLLPDMQELARAFAQSPATLTEGRLEALLNSLWKMTDDLALIREEFRAHVRQRGAAPPGGHPLDEVDSVIAQVATVEHAIVAIVAGLTEQNEPAPTPANSKEFLLRVARQKAEIFRKSETALLHLRLQAIQLSAAVHAFRSSLAVASSAIARAKR